MESIQILSKMINPIDYRPQTHHRLNIDDNSFDSRFNASIRVCTTYKRLFHNVMYDNFISLFTNIEKSLNELRNQMKMTIHDKMINSHEILFNILLIKSDLSIYDKSIQCNMLQEHLNHVLSWNTLVIRYDEYVSRKSSSIYDFLCCLCDLIHSQVNHNLKSNDLLKSMIINEKFNEKMRKLNEFSGLLQLLRVYSSIDKDDDIFTTNHHNSSYLNDQEVYCNHILSSIVIIVNNLDLIANDVIEGVINTFKQYSLHFIMIGVTSTYLSRTPLMRMSHKALASIQIKEFESIQPIALFDHFMTEILTRDLLKPVLPLSLVKYLSNDFHIHSLCVSSLLNR